MQKVPKFPQIDKLWMRIFCKLAHKSKLQHVMTKQRFWKSNLVSPFCFNFCGKSSAQSKVTKKLINSAEIYFWNHFHCKISTK